MKKLVTILCVIACMSLTKIYSQNTCDSLRYWVDNNLFTEYDTVGFNIEMHLFLSDKEFVFERYDHNLVFIIFGDYSEDDFGNLNLNYDTTKTIDFVPQFKEIDCSLKFIANLKSYRFINWKKNRDYISYEYILRENKCETKKYKLKRKNK